jgi:hypothetical protein
LFPHYVRLRRARFHDAGRQIATRRAAAAAAGAIALPLTLAGQAAAAEWTAVARWRIDPASPVMEIDSTDALNPGGRDVRLSIRLKTTGKPDKPDWDLIRKGYSASSGSLYNVEYQPTGQVSCIFKGSQDSTMLQDGPDLSDGRWHIIACVKTATSVSLDVDGKTVATENKEIGEISNDDPVVIGAHSGDGSSERFEGELNDPVMEVAGSPAPAGK